MNGPVDACAPLHAYHGGFLRIDVSRRTSQWQAIPSPIYRQFLGGTGLGAYLMLVGEQATVDPLSAAAWLAFVFSPLVGSPLTTSAKFAVVSKSPLTQRYNDSLASSTFALAGKQCGVDALVIEGQADAPTIICVDGPTVTFHAADALWGLATDVTERTLRDQFGQRFATAVIGPAGEHLVRYATITHDGRHAGRGGSGAVLGAKRVKAVLVSGKARVDWAEPAELARYAKQLSQRSLGPATEKYRELGTASNLLAFDRLQVLPTRNFQQTRFAQAARIAPETMAHQQSEPLVRASCAACTIGCEHRYAIGAAEPSHDNTTSHTSDAATPPRPTTSVRLEYESLFALGPLLAIDDPQIILRAVQACDALGLDTISAGGTLALAMECADHQLGPLDPPRFSQGEDVIGHLHNIAWRRGAWGDAMAEGSRRLAQSIGGRAPAWANHVKGLELPGYDPRALQTMALGFAVGARGADHNRSGAYEADFSGEVDRLHADARSVRAAIAAENRAALLDSLILCKFLRGAIPDLYAEAATMLQLTCGWSITAEELQTTVATIVNAKKLFNILAGWTPDEDTLPSRLLEVAPTDNPAARLTRPHLQQLVRDYNQQRGWTDDGYLPDSLVRSLQRHFITTPSAHQPPDQPSAILTNDTSFSPIEKRSP